MNVCLLSHIYFTAVHLLYYKDLEPLMRNIRIYNHLCPFLFCEASCSIIIHSGRLQLSEDTLQ